MSAVMDTAALSAAMRVAAMAIEARNTIPIRANVLIDAQPGLGGEAGRVRLTTTNLDHTISVPVEASVEEAFATTVDAKRLQILAGGLAKGSQVKLAQGKGGLILTTGRTRATLPCLPAKDFPMAAVAQGGEAVRFSAPMPALRAALNRIAHAISTEEVRYYLCGVFAHVVDGTLRLATTDGHRLGVVTVGLPDGAADLPDIIIPTHAVRFLLAREDEGEAEFTIDDRSVAVTFADGIAYRSKLIDGSFPNYERVIPKENPHRLSFDRDAMIDAVRRVMSISGEKKRIVAADISAVALVLSCRDAENGEVVEELAAEWDGEPMRFGANARYLLDQLAIMPAGPVTMHAHDPVAPILFGDGDVAARWVLMPCSVG